MERPSSLLFLVLTVLADRAQAVPGPDSVAVIANANIPESVALARRYVSARDIPAGQLCALDLPVDADIDLAALRARLIDPFEACVEAGSATDRIEAVLLVRGVPLRVSIPSADGMRVSLAAALNVARSRVGEEALLDLSPGQVVPCGENMQCFAPRIANPFTTGTFESGWSVEQDGVSWRPLLVTMLHGRDFAEAERLIDSALDAEEQGGAQGEFLFMDGADPARGVLDAEYAGLVDALQARGFEATRVPFDGNLVGRRLAAFTTGTAALGETIEGNDFAPGSLVDNLTSYGAVPENFSHEAESQVSISRWVAQGVGGAHGTTDEPLNCCFPSRQFILDYVDGGTLAEAYWRRMPVVYWRDLVLGDPMLAPYATRPEVRFEGLEGGDLGAGEWDLRISASDPLARPIETLRLYLDGREIALEEGRDSVASTCLEVEDGSTLLAVAQVKDDGSLGGAHRPKGWATLLVTSEGADGAPCSTPDAEVAPDAGQPDAGVPPDAANTITDAAAPDDPPPTEHHDAVLTDAVDGGSVNRIQRGGGGCSFAGGLHDLHSADAPLRALRGCAPVICLALVLLLLRSRRLRRARD